MKKLSFFLMAMLVSLTSFAASVEFVAGTDKTADGTTAVANCSLTKDGITIKLSNGCLGRDDNYRIYQGQYITVTSTVGNITSIEFTCTANGTTKYGPGCFDYRDNNGAYTYADKIGTWTGDAAEVILYASSAQVRATKIVVTVGEGGGTTPDDGGETPDDGGETPEVTADTITCAEAVAICQETGETATSVEYTVRGYVTNIKYAWSEKFGTATFWIADTKDGGDVLQAYNCAPLKDADKVFAVGAYVELVGKLKKYGTTNEVEKGTYTVITPAEGGQTPDDGGETPVDTITVAAGLALTDNATCVLNPFTVIYVSGAYVYIEDESAYALLYQYESGLKAGDQVSGMEVTKTTYQDIAQFKPTTMENLTIVAGTAPAIDEITTAPTVADNHLVKLMNVTLAGAIAAGKTVVATCNDNTTINIYSKFDFTIEEGKSYNIIGGVTQYNGTIQIQAYEVEETIGAPSAIDNITINQNATKFIKNGQLFIVKDGVRYNAIGQVTK